MMLKKIRYAMGTGDFNNSVVVMLLTNSLISCHDLVLEIGMYTYKEDDNQKPLYSKVCTLEKGCHDKR